MTNADYMCIALLILWIMSFIVLVLFVIGFTFSPAFKLFSVCLWRGHKPEPKAQEGGWIDVYCQDCTKPLGAYHVPSTFEKWMKTFPSKWKRLPDEEL